MSTIPARPWAGVLLESRVRTLAVGLDISPAHCGLVALGDGRLLAVAGVVGVAKDAVRGLERCPIEIRKIVDRDHRDVCRLAWTMELVRAFITTCRLSARVCVAAIEGYALSQLTGAYQIGETCGAVKQVLLAEDIPFRVHDPTSVKVFATGRGDAQKCDMAEAVWRKWGERFRSYRSAEEDLADAYVIARMADAEHAIRTGGRLLQDCPEEEIRVWNRVTEKRAVNVLVRPWIGWS